MSYLRRRHPQRFSCKCGAPHLVIIVDEHAEGGDDWSGLKRHVEFADWFAPGKAVSRCNSCGVDLLAVWPGAPQTRDAVYVGDERVI